MPHNAFARRYDVSPLLIAPRDAGAGGPFYPLWVDPGVTKGVRAFILTGFRFHPFAYPSSPCVH